MARTPAAELEWKMVWDGKELAMGWYDGGGGVEWKGCGGGVAGG